MTGSFLVTATFGTTTLTSAGGRDIFVTKLDTNGNFLWALQDGGTGLFDQGFGIAIDQCKNLYVHGRFVGTGTFGTIK